MVINMVIIDILLTIAIDKYISTWYDVLFKIADDLRWRTKLIEKEVSENVSATSAPREAKSGTA